VNFKTEWRNWAEGTLGLGRPSHNNGIEPDEIWVPLLPVRARQLYVRHLERLTPTVVYFLRSPLLLWAARLIWFLNHVGLNWVTQRVAMRQSATLALKQVLPVGSGAQPTVILFGSPGPFQKVIVLSTHFGQASVISKVAFRPSADEKIAHEAAWLERLSAIPDIEGMVPKLLKHGLLTSGRSYLTTSISAASPLCKEMTGLHHNFLHILCSKSLRHVQWRDSNYRQSLLARFQRILRLNANGNLNVPFTAWQQLDQTLSKQVVPVCIVHGDFAPWNISLLAENITVFDWEYAQEEASPLHDYFHFHCIQRALQRNPKMSADWLVNLLKSSELHLKPVTNGMRQINLTLNIQMLALYLLDTISMYLEVNGRFEIGNPVIDGYIECLANPLILSKTLSCNTPLTE
jgi:Phosphotransferase enzyme family